jgi:hypothetical protein
MTPPQRESAHRLIAIKAKWMLRRLGLGFLVCGAAARDVVALARGKGRLAGDEIMD